MNNEFTLFRGAIDNVPIIHEFAAVLSAPTAIVSAGISLFAAPGANFGAIGSMIATAEVPVVARTADFAWVQINTVNGFAHTHGFANGNHNAIAILATSNGDDVFGGVPAYSFVQGSGDSYDCYAIGFADVDGYSGGSAAIAYLGTTATGKDAFGSVPTYSFVSGAGYAVYVVGFHQTQASVLALGFTECRRRENERSDGAAPGCLKRSVELLERLPYLGEDHGQLAKHAG